VGNWKGTNFTAGAAPTNAVLVPAKRNVASLWESVGLDAMNPATHSIAALEGLGCLTNIAPFGVTTDQVAQSIAAGGGTMTLNSDTVGSGKQGALNLNDLYGNTGLGKPT